MNKPQWAEVEAWATKQLANARSANERVDLPHEQAIALRARIQVLKELIALPTLNQTLAAQSRMDAPE